jgi:hypothetical protein
MRPDSYDDRPPFNRCGTCEHCHYVRYHEQQLCFHGDAIVARRDGPGEWDKSDVEFAGDAVELLDGETFGKVWGGRVVASDATCEEWLQRREESQEQREHTDRSEA